jgi:hypothetical protein
VDTWIVVALVAWSSVAVLLALLVGRVLTRSEHEDRAARAAQRTPVSAPVVVPIRSAGSDTDAGIRAQGRSASSYRQRSAS